MDLLKLQIKNLNAIINSGDTTTVINDSLTKTEEATAETTSKNLILELQL